MRLYTSIESSKPLFTLLRKKQIKRKVDKRLTPLIIIRKKAGLVATHVRIFW